MEGTGGGGGGGGLQRNQEEGKRSGQLLWEERALVKSELLEMTFIPLTTPFSIYNTVAVFVDRPAGVLSFYRMCSNTPASSCPRTPRCVGAGSRQAVTRTQLENYCCYLLNMFHIQVNTCHSKFVSHTVTSLRFVLDVRSCVFSEKCTKIGLVCSEICFFCSSACCWFVCR